MVNQSSPAWLPTAKSLPWNSALRTSGSASSISIVMDIGTLRGAQRLLRLVAGALDQVQTSLTRQGFDGVMPVTGRSILEGTMTWRALTAVLALATASL